MENILNSFITINMNALYYVIYLLKYNFFFLIVLGFIGFMLMQDLKLQNFEFESDERRII